MSKATSWKRLPAVEGRLQPCLHAGVAENLFPADGCISVGLGSAALTCDGRLVWAEDMAQDGDYYIYIMTGTIAETLAAADPDHDWRIYLHGALSGLEYQRHGPERWVLVHQDKGFA